MTETAIVTANCWYQPPGDPGDEGGRDEHGGQDDRDGDDRPGHLLHRLEGRLLGGHAALDVVLHRLHDDDRVIHDEPDGEDQAEEREGVDGEAEEREEGEGPTSDTGTARSGMSVALHPWRKMNTTMMTRASASKRVLTISLDPLGDRQGGVEADRVVHVVGEAGLQLLHQLPGALDGLDGVGARHW